MDRTNWRLAELDVDHDVDRTNGEPWEPCRCENGIPTSKPWERTETYPNPSSTPSCCFFSRREQSSNMKLALDGEHVDLLREKPNGDMIPTEQKWPERPELLSFFRFETFLVFDLENFKHCPATFLSACLCKLTKYE